MVKACVQCDKGGRIVWQVQEGGHQLHVVLQKLHLRLLWVSGGGGGGGGEGGEFGVGKGL